MDNLTFCSTLAYYSEIQKTVEYEDDIVAIFKCMLSCSKENSFTRLTRQITY